MRAILTTVAVALIVASAGDRARADLMFELQGVTFNTGGTLTGTFTTDDAITTLTSADLVTSADTPNGFAGFEFIFPGTSNNINVIPGGILLNSNGTNQIQLVFSAPLTATGAGISAGSEFDSHAGFRGISGNGRVVAFSAVPEPASLAMLGTAALAGLAWARRRRRGV